jgi:hypothetical protein
VDDDDLSVEDRPLDRDIERIGDNGKAVGPVVTVAGIDRGALIEVDLQPVAVVLNFVDPLASDGCPGFQGGKLRRNKPGHFRRHGAFDHPRDEAGLGTLGHYATHKTPV